MQPKDIADHILKEMKVFWQDKQNKWDDERCRSDREWTLDIKKLFEKIGKNMDNKEGKLYITRASGIEQSSEYLVDIAIIEHEKDPEWKNQGDIVVAIESEWSVKPDDVLYDFMKLCDIKADVKVIIYTDLQSIPEKNWSDAKILPKLTEKIKKCRHNMQNGDLYLAIGIPDCYCEKNATPKAYIYDTNQDSNFMPKDYSKW